MKIESTTAPLNRGERKIVSEQKGRFNRFMSSRGFKGGADNVAAVRLFIKYIKGQDLKLKASVTCKVKRDHDRDYYSSIPYEHNPAKMRGKFVKAKPVIAQVSQPLDKDVEIFPHVLKYPVDFKEVSERVSKNTPYSTGSLSGGANRKRGTKRSRCKPALTSDCR